MRSRTVALAALLLVLTVSACGTEVDTAKHVGNRTTIPGSGTPTTTSSKPDSTSNTGAVEPALATDKLRLIDPCSAFDRDGLAQYGTVGDLSLSDFDSCSFDTTGAGSVSGLFSFERTIYPDETDKIGTIGGLSSVEHKIESGTCFQQVITTKSKDDTRGIWMQVHADGGDSCAIALKLMESSLTKIRNGGVQYPPTPASLIPVQPCSLYDAAQATTLLGKPATLDKDTDLHRCRWSTSDYTGSVVVWLHVGVDPGTVESDKPTPVDVNGVKAFTRASASAGGCVTAWTHGHPSSTSAKVASYLFEVAEVEISPGGSPVAGTDYCALALTAAKAVEPKLPR